MTPFTTLCRMWKAAQAKSPIVMTAPRTRAAKTAASMPASVHARDVQEALSGRPAARLAVGGAHLRDAHARVMLRLAPRRHHRLRVNNVALPERLEDRTQFRIVAGVLLDAARR